MLSAGLKHIVWYAAAEDAAGAAVCFATFVLGLLVDVGAGGPEWSVPSAAKPAVEDLSRLARLRRWLSAEPASCFAAAEDLAEPAVEGAAAAAGDETASSSNQQPRRHSSC